MHFRLAKLIEGAGHDGLHPAARRGAEESTDATEVGRYAGDVGGVRGGVEPTPETKKTVIPTYRGIQTRAGIRKSAQNCRQPIDFAQRESSVAAKCTS